MVINYDHNNKTVFLAYLLFSYPNIFFLNKYSSKKSFNRPNWKTDQMRYYEIRYNRFVFNDWYQKI